MIKKQMYEAPKIEVLELKMRGAVLQLSIGYKVDGEEGTYDGGYQNWGE